MAFKSIDEINGETIVLAVRINGSLPLSVIVISHTSLWVTLPALWHDVLDDDDDGQVFPQGWDKTFCLQFIEKEFHEIHFFGDKTYKVNLSARLSIPLSSFTPSLHFSLWLTKLSCRVSQLIVWLWAQKRKKHLIWKISVSKAIFGRANLEIIGITVAREVWVMPSFSYWRSSVSSCALNLRSFSRQWGGYIILQELRYFWSAVLLIFFLRFLFFVFNFN